MNLHFQILFVSILLGTLSTIHGQHIRPLQDSDGSSRTTKNGLTIVDASGLGEGTSFYQSASLEIQLLDTDPVFTFQNTFRSPNLFYGESDNGAVSLTLLRQETETDQVLTGVLYDRQRNLFYELRRDADGQQTVRVTPEADIPKPGDPLNAPTSKWQHLLNFHSTTPILPTLYQKLTKKFTFSSRQEEQQNCPTQINVMIVWTQSSECYHSNLDTGCTLTNETLANMNAAVQLMVEETNMAFLNSNINAELILVHTIRDNSCYVESDMSQTLTHISGLDFQLDYIQFDRATRGIDLVQMIVDNRIDSAKLGGIAWLPRRNVLGLHDAAAGFSVVCAQCLIGYISAHEFGHNLGCEHDRGTSNACSSCATNYGYRSPTSSFRTIMSYSCVTGQCDNNPGGTCPVIPYYSGEDTYTNGESMGGPNNNCRSTIDSMKGTISLYRYGQYLPIPDLNLFG